LTILNKLVGWWRWGKWAALAYLSACLSLYLCQERLIFKPQAAIKTTPADRNLAYQDVWLPVNQTGANQEKLFGWWLPAQGKTIGTILYLHGYSDNIGANLDPADHLTQLGFAVFLVDYRGYGKSQGDFPFEKQIYADAEVAWDYLVQTRKIAPAQIIIYGHSMGGAIAIDLATRHPNAGSLIVQSSFTSMSAMADRAWWYKLVPLQLLLTQRFDSLAKVRSLKMPVLYIHGTADRFVPAEMSRALYTATATKNKQLVMVANAQHENSSPEFKTPEHLETLIQFTKQAIVTQK
jgi:alpha-beta hydrolase superfamily lysophospholipase